MQLTANPLITLVTTFLADRVCRSAERHGAGMKYSNESCQVFRQRVDHYADAKLFTPILPVPAPWIASVPPAGGERNILRESLAFYEI
jgi:hypothetical protein